VEDHFPKHCLVIHKAPLAHYAKEELPRTSQKDPSIPAVGAPSIAAIAL
jgi:hypothetical protein